MRILTLRFQPWLLSFITCCWEECFDIPGRKKEVPESEYNDIDAWREQSRKFPIQFVQVDMGGHRGLFSWFERDTVRETQLFPRCPEHRATFCSFESANRTESAFESLHCLLFLGQKCGIAISQALWLTGVRLLGVLPVDFCLRVPFRVGRLNGVPTQFSQSEGIRPPTFVHVLLGKRDRERERERARQRVSSGAHL